MVQFGQWEAILADRGPRFDTPFTRGAWRYARAMAFVATDRLDEAEQELTALKALVDDPALVDPATFSNNSGKAILRIAPEVIAGELAARRRDWDAALLHLERAVRYQDALIYQEPPDWHQSVRLRLGAVLLKAGRPDEAEAVFWQDLRLNSENGWALSGLLQALKAQDKRDEAAQIEARLARAWKNADVRLSDTLEPMGLASAAGR
jgi:tetratricopeptide (TPR) repeat protein